LPAGHVDGHAAIDEAEAVGDGGRGAAAAARRERVAGTALPDFDADIRAVDDLEELDIGLAGEERMFFEVRAVSVSQLGRHRGQGDDAVGVADRRRAEGEFTAKDGDFLIDHLAVRAGQSDGDFITVEADRSHRNREELTVFLDHNLNVTAGSFHRESCFRDELLIPKKAGEDAKAVAGFFRFGSVRIEYPQTKFTQRGGKWPPENAVGADAEIAMTDDSDLLDRRSCLPRRKIAGIEDNVVVAEGVVFVEAHEWNAEASSFFGRKTREKTRNLSRQPDLD